MFTVNSYNIVGRYRCVLYHAVATSKEHVRKLAEEASIDIDGLEIELIRVNVKDQLGYPFKPYIEDALIY